MGLFDTDEPHRGKLIIGRFVRRLRCVAFLFPFLTVLTKLFASFLMLGLLCFELRTLFRCEDGKDLGLDRFVLRTHLFAAGLHRLTLFGCDLAAGLASFVHGAKFGHLRFGWLVCFVDLTDLFFLSVGQIQPSKAEHSTTHSTHSVVTAGFITAHAAMAQTQTAGSSSGLITKNLASNAIAAVRLVMVITASRAFSL